jgi:hypothetical protein
MKRIITSAGLVALGVAGAQAQANPPQFGSADLSRPWSVSASLRGFYDDNYLTARDDSAQKRHSFGFSVSPQASVALSNDQTDFGARYVFGMMYYDDRKSSKEDYTHQFDLSLNHSFSPRYSVGVSDSFVISQEPTVVDPTGATSLPYRAKGDNIRNLGSVTFNASLAELLTAVLGYSNTYYDYQQKNTDINPVTELPIEFGSYSALLDRMEHSILANLRWQFQPSTVGVFGYQYGVINYTADELIVNPLSTGGVEVRSSVRDKHTHTMYVGADQTFTPALSASVRLGAEYSEAFNANPSEGKWGPYADLSATYRYGAGCNAQLGFRQFFTQTDVLAQNASSSVVYGSVNHRITPQLMASVMASYQYSKFNGGAYGESVADGQTQNYFLAGVNLSYEFARHFSADVGYNFDTLSSKAAGRYDWTRNRAYVGVTATY